MIEISVGGLCKSYGGTVILDDISFDINTGQRVGLVGANGSGKTTLFRILGGLAYDKGSVVIAKGRSVGILDQIPDYPAGVSAETVMRGAFIHVEELKRQLEETSSALAADSSPGLLARYGRLESRYEQLGGYETEVFFAKVANGMGISQRMLGMDFDSLSGGEKTRVNIARMILMKTDILLLDEPTNHLDIKAAEWLEEYLTSYNGTVMIISHDRYFLDRTVTRTLELERGRLGDWPGNYSYFVQAKADALERMESVYNRQMKDARRLEYTAARMRGWGTNDRSMMRRAIALERRIERLKTISKPERTEIRLSGRFTESSRSGNDALTIKGLSKSFGDKTLFSGLDMEIRKDEAVAIVGENGSGKSTLIKLLLGELEADSGRVRFGANTKTAYLPQTVVFEHPERSILDTLLYELDIDYGPARDRLAAFSFKGEEVFKTVSTLSGGEKSRLRLCLEMYGEVNFLLLDEPTNHLDITSREWIETALEGFEGTMIFVSHDRYFLSRMATRVLELSCGEAMDFRGTYEEYRVLERKKSVIEEKPKETRGSYALAKERKVSEKRVAALEREIEALESQIRGIDIEINDNASDYVKITDLLNRKNEIATRVSELMGEWETESAGIL